MRHLLILTAFLLIGGVSHLVADLDPTWYWRTTYNGQYTDTDIFGPLVPHGWPVENAIDTYHSDYIGIFYGKYFPWVYTDAFGWMYFDESDPSVIYVPPKIPRINPTLRRLSFEGWYKLGKLKVVIPSDGSRPFWAQDWYSFAEDKTFEVNLSWIFADIEFR